MLNLTTLQGRLTRDPELYKTTSGKSVTKCSIACERDFGEKATDFFPIECWGSLAEFVLNNFEKGQMAVISGRLQNSKWTDRDGYTRTQTAIVVQNIYFAGPKPTAPAPADPAPASKKTQPAADDNFIPDYDFGEDDLPF